MPAYKRTTDRAFTLIELLVVVAIIALLISILLPSLSCARAKARASKCGVQLRGFGTGLATYFTENNDWIPGINTSGVAAYVAGMGNDLGALRSPATPVQTYDWMSPSLRYETELGNNRAERFQTLINAYRCPSQEGLKVDFLWPDGLAYSEDRDDFTDDIVDTYAPLSYLMPAQFQWWGREHDGAVIAVGRTPAGRPITVEAMVPPENFEAWHPGRYQSRLDKLGPPARKIAAADGMRYLTENDEIDFDITPYARWFGAFASSGAWWAGSTEYGVKAGTPNWDGTPTGQNSADPPAEGRNLVWSYRHGCTNRARITEGVRDNAGEINALFFDGHVARLDDRASRNIEYWYPTGTVVQHPSEGLTDVPAGSEVP
jgi:prepilin-type N-terminal cleavage/methylation domain-containing protein/prepilin-type processing-associated H-X9-DG protein